MRGIPITKPMTAQEIADACDVSLRTVRRYRHEGYLHSVSRCAHDRRRKLYIGLIPIPITQWRERMRSIARQYGKEYMVGLEGRTLMVLVADEIREIEYGGSLSDLERAVAGLEACFNVV